METLTKMQKIEMGTKEIAIKIRMQLKQEFPACVFSVVMKSFSGGSEINVSLMSAPFEVFDKSKPFDMNGNQINWNHAQLNEYSFSSLHNFTSEKGYSNGHYLTEQTWRIMQRICKIVNQFNYDESDIQTDYFNVNFYFHLGIGKWDKPFKTI